MEVVICPLYLNKTREGSKKVKIIRASKPKMMVPW